MLEYLWTTIILKMEMRKRELIIGGIHTIANQSVFELNEREVEQKANTKRGALYEEFSSKKEFVDQCFFYVINEIFKSNEKLLKIGSDDISIKEKGRNIWFNTIAWWLGHPDMFYFYLKYINSNYYYDNHALNSENRKPYFMLVQKAIDAGIIKPLPVEFSHELIVSQMLNTLNYIKKNPKLSADSEFLDLSFEAIWDSLSAKK